MSSFVVLHMFLNRLDNSFIVIASGGRLDHDGLGHFTSGLVRNGDHGTVCDCWVGEQMSFELRWSDL